jgi:outer membrane protein assembly factor BamB
VVVAVAGCGGGGGSSKKKPQPAASVSVAITTPAISAEAILGDDFRAAVGGTWTGSNLGTSQVYLQVSDSAGTFAMPAAQLASGGAFNYSLPLVANVAPGPHTGTVTVRACKDSQCAQPYAGASASINYQLQVFEPSLAVAITSPAIAETVDLGDNFIGTVAGTWSATHLGTNKVYLQVSDNAGTFTTPAPQLQAAGSSTFSFSLPLAGGLSAPRSGLLTVRACKDALCTQPYANTVTSVAYQLQFMRIDEWETHQRNASHDGYVPITLDPSKFAKVWEWQRPPASEPVGGINAVATSNGSVYVSTSVYFGEGKLYSLDENNGQLRWNVSFGTVPGLNPPAYHDGRVYVTTTGHSDTFLWSFDAADGTFKFKSPFAAQWSSILAPTAYGGQVYVADGYFGGTVYAYDRMDGTSLWSGNNGGDDDMSTPAVDANNAYYHTGAALVIWNRMTGQLVANIPDPFATASGYSYHGAPMLGGRNNVIAFAGSAFSGRANANSEQYDQRVLSSFNIGTKAWEWATQNAYLTQPAVAKGVIYAGRNRPMSLDAIDETTGKILWSWAPTPELGDTEFHRNIIVTRNLLFVGTNTGVYAVDLATHKPVWRYAATGMMAISANRTLYIATGATTSDGKLVAIKLK